MIKIVTVVFIILCSLSNAARGQDDGINGFALSFMRFFKYPATLKGSCKATIAVIKISKQEGQLVLTISDSADILFKKEFDRIRNKLDTAEMKQFLFSENIDAILIPVSFTYASDYCDKPVEPTGIANLFHFDGKVFTGKTQFFQGIGMKLLKPVKN